MKEYLIKVEDRKKPGFPPYYVYSCPYEECAKRAMMSGARWALHMIKGHGWSLGFATAKLNDAFSEAERKPKNGN